MGRKKQVLSPQEIEERKNRWWGEDRNARRRERYQNDPAYRAKAITQVRTSYRKSREDAGLEVRDEDCRQNIKRIHEFGLIRELRVDEERTVRMLTFASKELARCLDRNPQVVYRWISSGLVPGPVNKARNTRNRWEQVYTPDEVRAIMNVFGEHQQTSQYFRSYHTETRDKMVAALEVVRTAANRRASQ